MNISNVSKAIAGAIVTGLMAYLVKKGIVLDASVSEAVTVLVTAVVGFIFVYLSPKNK